MIEEGEFDVFLKSSDRPVFHYKPGDSFGELALMCVHSRPVALRPCGPSCHVKPSLSIPPVAHSFLCTPRALLTHQKHPPPPPVSLTHAHAHAHTHPASSAAPTLVAIVVPPTGSAPLGVLKRPLHAL